MKFFFLTYLSRLCPINIKLRIFHYCSNCSEFSQSIIYVCIFTITTIISINANILPVIIPTTNHFPITLSFIGCNHKKSNKTHRQIFNICIKTCGNQFTSNKASLTFSWTNFSFNINSRTGKLLTSQFRGNFWSCDKHRDSKIFG